MYVVQFVQLQSSTKFKFRSNSLLCVIIRLPCGDSIGVDLAGRLGGRRASAEGGSVSSGVAYGEKCSLSSRLRGLGERRNPNPYPKTDFGVF